MFAYALSASTAFIVFGVIYNILRNIKPDWFDEFYGVHWAFILIISCFWVITIPILAVVAISFILKIFVDKISQFILKRVKK